MNLSKRNETYFPSFFDRFLNNELMDWNLTNFSERNSSLPAVNVKENQNEFLIEVAAPGMKKDDFKISLDNNLLTISSEKKEENEEKNEKFTRREFSYQTFQRSFTIAESAIDSSNISAKYEDGILNIVLPKREEVKPKPLKVIEIV